MEGPDSLRTPACVQVGLGLLVLALSAHLVAALLGQGEHPLVTVWLYHLVEVAAFGLIAARVVAVRAHRAAWALLAGYVALTTVGDVSWAIVAVDGEVPAGEVPDVFYYAAYPAAYAGVVLLLRGRSRWFTPSMWLDGVIGGLGLGALTAAVVLTPVLATRGDVTALELTVNVGYVVADLLLLGFVGLAAGLLGGRPGRSWSLIGLAFIATAVVDGLYTYAEATGAFYPGSAFATLWPAGPALLAIAAWQPQGVERRAHADLAGALMPALFFAIALAVLAAAHWYRIDDAGIVLAVAAMLAAACRGILTHRENLELLRRSRTEALTDALTGLRNRRRLMEDLEEALGAARERRQPYTLVFFDLDGFKLYNDSFGHNAGDALLQRLGGALCAATGGAAYRLGGDEFCVLLPGRHGATAPAVAAASAALCARGEGFTIGASLGLVALPEDADSPSLALQRADERMYAEKGGRRGSARSQTRDILLQILGEREPALRRHMDQVASMAVATARVMGLQGELIDEVCRAAELHDIGKVAIPDGVLHKPAPLDDDEWALMRQHTIIGERILLAAPALRPVAALVRSSHERWDGRGYPDALAGEEIPLGSRIVGVCDAYDAMTSDRSYRAAMSREAAFAELRSHAAQQFDPAVVDAFIAAVTSRAMIAA